MNGPGERSTASQAKSLAVTRPVGQGADTAALVQSLGWTPFIFHTVEPTRFDLLRVRDQVEASMGNRNVSWVVFFSPIGVDLVFDAISAYQGLKDAIQEIDLLAVGPRTRDSLVKRGAKRVLVPERYSSAGVDEFFNRMDTKALGIVLVRSSSADDVLASSLSSRGASVTTINAYESSIPQNVGSVSRFLDLLSEDRLHGVLFTSAISVSNLFKIAESRIRENELSHLLRGVPIGAIGPATAKELAKHQIQAIVPEEYLIKNALVKLISQFPANAEPMVAD